MEKSEISVLPTHSVLNVPPFPYGNRAYEMVSWKVHHALIKAKLEPYLGFPYSMVEGKPSLICDFRGLCRYLMDDFVIQYCGRLGKKGFTLKKEDFSTDKEGERGHLSDIQINTFVGSLKGYFYTEVERLRIRMDKSQEIETLINEEALLFAQYSGNEKQAWVPRIAKLF
jgi:CRISPR/Cas system-associated endonuclease Cas1